MARLPRCYRAVRMGERVSEFVSESETEGNFVLIEGQNELLRPQLNTYFILFASLK